MRDLSRRISRLEEAAEPGARLIVVDQVHEGPDVDAALMKRGICPRPQDTIIVLRDMIAESRAAARRR